jgi:15-cis-phytoene synthase
MDAALVSPPATGAMPVLDASYRTLRRKARTFHLASRLLPRHARDDAAVVYAFCRLLDDAVDEAESATHAAAEVARIGDELAARRTPRPLIAAFLATAARIDLPMRAAEELLEGVRTDIGAVRVADDDALIRYCYRVASTVGLMMCAVLDVRRPDALPYAVDLGIAMQLTNIARDVAEDAAIDRVYLPGPRLRDAGVLPDDLVAGTADRAAVSAAVLGVLDLADRYYGSADDGMRFIPWRCRQAILVASRVYRAIGVVLRRRGGDALAGRAIVPALGKTAAGARAVFAAAHPRILGLAPPRPRHPRLHAPISGLPGAHPPRP